MSFNKIDVTNLLSILKSGKENAQTHHSLLMIDTNDLFDKD